MSHSFWKKPRSNHALVKQWGRRVSAPHGFILREVENRMMTRAAILRPVEGSVLHQGCLHPGAVQALSNCFPDRALQLVTPGEAQKPLFNAPVRSAWWRPWAQAPASIVRHCIAAPGVQVPLADESQALVWSPLWLHALEKPQTALAEWQRLLKPGGGLFFSVLGPDTARELAPFAQALGAELPDYPDMHDLGDLVGQQGFSDPVMEMERLTLTYPNASALLAEWHALLGNTLETRKNCLTGRARMANAVQALTESQNTPSGRLSLTLELVYGHAWKVPGKKQAGLATVAVSAIGGRKPQSATQMRIHVDCKARFAL